jgi:hypothetical protein
MAQASECMWMCNAFIIVDQKNADRNSVNEIAAAVFDVGAIMLAVDEASATIEATVPAVELPTIRSMEGVAYVRCAFNYFATHPQTSRAA